MSTLSQTYNDLGEPETESWSDGPLAGHSVTSSRDGFGRRLGLTASVAGIQAQNVAAYDPAGRPAILTAGSHTATYRYVANSRLRAGVTYRANGTQRLDTQYDFDRLNRLQQVFNQPSAAGQPAERHAYYAAQQRIRDELADGSSWNWKYDRLGQVIGGGKSWPDGKGNVMGLVNAADGTWSARYEYGPFGEVVRATGTMAAANPFRWSTKIQDEDSGLNYYGYRYYSAGVGRWLGRDPIGERVGINQRGLSILQLWGNLFLKGMSKSNQPLPKELDLSVMDIAGFWKFLCVSCCALLLILSGSACDQRSPEGGELRIDSAKLSLMGDKAAYKRRAFTGVAVGNYRGSTNRSHEIHYVDGEFHGERLYWFENGMPWQKWEYKSGKLHGTSRVWHENGKLESERGYLNGEEHGLHRKWNDKGELVSSQLFEHGKSVSAQ